MKLNKDWDFFSCLVVIEDPNAVPGKTIYDFFKILMEVLELKFIVLDYIVGGGVSIANYQNQSDLILNISDFLKELKGVDQFERGDFFLFRDYPSEWENPDEESYPYVIQQTDTTLRVVDNTYLYLYTPYSAVEKQIMDVYKIESIKIASLEKLDYHF